MRKHQHFFIPKSILHSIRDALFCIFLYTSMLFRHSSFLMLIFLTNFCYFSYRFAIWTEILYTSFLKIDILQCISIYIGGTRLLYKLCLITLLFILGITLIVVSYFIHSSLLFGLGLGIIFSVLIMWLPDILLWMIKGGFPQEDILLEKSKVFTILAFSFPTVPRTQTLHLNVFPLWLFKPKYKHKFTLIFIFNKLSHQRFGHIY